MGLRRSTTLVWFRASLTCANTPASFLVFHPLTLFLRTEADTATWNSILASRSIIPTTDVFNLFYCLCFYLYRPLHCSRYTFGLGRWASDQCSYLTRTSFYPPISPPRISNPVSSRLPATLRQGTTAITLLEDCSDSSLPSVTRPPMVKWCSPASFRQATMPLYFLPHLGMVLARRLLSSSSARRSLLAPAVLDSPNLPKTSTELFVHWVLAPCLR
jgi:hypothetical protein